MNEMKYLSLPIAQHTADQQSELTFCGSKEACEDALSSPEWFLQIRDIDASIRERPLLSRSGKDIGTDHE
jgi:hypothetical protein